MTQIFNILFVSLCLLSFQTNAQRRLDKLRFIDGTILSGVVSRIESDAVLFSPGKAGQSIRFSKKSIYQIIFSSGKVETYAAASSANALSYEWRAVRFTSDPDDTLGLVFKGVVGARARILAGLFRFNSSDKPLIENIKKQAAKKKAHIILLTLPSEDDVDSYPAQGKPIYGRAYGWPELTP